MQTTMRSRIPTIPAGGWQDFLTGELLAFRLIGRSLYSHPDREWLDRLLAEDIFAEIPLSLEHPDIGAALKLLQQWSAANEGGLSDRAFQAIKVDYARLFIGIDGVLAPPWESVHLSREHLLFQEQTVQVRSWYRQYKLEVVQQNREPDDHVGLELIFLSHLAQEAMSALAARDEVRFAALLNAQQDFLAEHVLRWIPQWSRQVEQHAQSDLLRGLALLTRGLLLALAEALAVPGPAAAP